MMRQKYLQKLKILKMDYKKTKAARTTISRNMEELSQNVGGNVYELISV